MRVSEEIPGYWEGKYDRRERMGEQRRNKCIEGEIEKGDWYEMPKTDLLKRLETLKQGKFGRRKSQIPKPCQLPPCLP